MNRVVDYLLQQLVHVAQLTWRLGLWLQRLIGRWVRRSGRHARGPALSGLDREALEEDLGHLVRELGGRWAYLEDKRQTFGVDCQSLVDQALEAADAAASYGEALGLFVAGLHDGHAAVLPPGWEQSLGERDLRRWSLRYRIVEAADAHGPAGDGESTTLRLDPGGDLVVTVDGEEVETALRRLSRLQPASSPWHRRALAVAALCGEKWAQADLPPPTLRLGVRAPGGAEVERELTYGPAREIGRAHV